MWQAHPLGWLARKYAVEEGGRPVAELEFGWSGHGTITHGDERLEIVREGRWNPKFHLEQSGKRLASAYRTSLVRSAFTIELDEEVHSLAPSSWLGRSHVLLRGTRNLGEIRPLDWLGRRLQVGLDADLAPELRLFVLWLTLLVRRRGAAAAAT